jgi:hypothetical protein
LKNTREAEGHVEEEEWAERGGQGRCLVRDTIFIKGENNIYGLQNCTQYPFVLLVKIGWWICRRVGREGSKVMGSEVGCLSMQQGKEIEHLGRILNYTEF